MVCFYLEARNYNYRNYELTIVDEHTFPTSDDKRNDGIFSLNKEKAIFVHAKLTLW